MKVFVVQSPKTNKTRIFAHHGLAADSCYRTWPDCEISADSAVEDRVSDPEGNLLAVILETTLHDIVITL